MSSYVKDADVFRHMEKSEYAKDSGDKVVGQTCLVIGCRETPKWGVWCDQHRPYKPVEKEHK